MMNDLPCLSTGLYTELAMIVLREAWHNGWTNHSGHPFTMQTGDVFRKHDGEVVVKVNRGSVEKQGTKKGLRVNPHVANAVKFFLYDKYNSQLWRFLQHSLTNDEAEKLADEDIALHTHCMDSYGSYGRRSSMYNNQDSRSIKTTVAELYCIYEFLHGASRAQLVKRYGEALLNKVVGSPNDPFVAQSADALEKMIDDLTREENDKVREIDNEKNVALSALTREGAKKRQEIRNKYTQKIEDLERECLKKVDEVVDKTNLLKSKVIDEFSEKAVKMRNEYEAKIMKLKAQLDELLKVKMN